MTQIKLSAPLVTILCLFWLGLACGSGGGAAPGTASGGKPTSAIIVRAPLGQIIGPEAVQIPATADSALGPMQFAVQPATLASVADGKVSCQGSGDGTVVASLGVESVPIPFSCVLPSKIDAPPTIQLRVGKPVDFAPTALDAGGTVLTGLALAVEVADTSILTYANGQLSPQKVGSTRVTIGAGGASATTDIEVDATELDDSFQITSGSAKAWDLDPGSYRLSIRGTTKHGISVRWDGAACGDRPAAASHQFACTLKRKARLYLDNNSGADSVPVERGQLTVLRVPG